MRRSPFSSTVRRSRWTRGPSDAIALAIRAEAPIFAADDVIEESAIEFEGEEVTEEEIESRVSEFKQFLDEVTPDEFAIEPEDE